MWNDETSSAARLLEVQHNAILAPVFSGIQHCSQLLKGPVTARQDCPFAVAFLWVFFHLQAQIPKGGSNWPTDSLLWLLNKGHFKEMSLGINRQNYQLIAYCWLTVENHWNRHFSLKSPVCHSAKSQIAHCSFASSSLTLCSIPGEV